MAGRTGRRLLLIAFSAALGHLAWHALVGPPPSTEYLVSGNGQALAGADEHDRQLYVRRSLYLPRPPRHAWLQVVGRDRFRLYVNSRFLSEQILDGFPVATVVDLTPYLQAGHNVIAIAAHQSSIGRPPALAVDGAYFLDDGEHRLGSDAEWRCCNVFDRGDRWWFETDFKDGHWVPARIVSRSLCGKVSRPPRSVITAGMGKWLTPPRLERGVATVRRDFEVDGRPAQAWLRVTATCAYRLAVNGLLLDEQEEQLATTLPVPPVRRVYDLTGLVQRGANSVALALTSTSGLPHVLTDLEVENQAGVCQDWGSDGDWRSCPGLPPDWLDPASDHSADWQAGEVEPGDLGILPGQPQRQDVAIALPLALVLRRGFEQAVLMVLIGLATLLAGRLLARRLGAVWPEGVPKVEGLVFLSLLPVTAAIAAALLATYDPRVARQDVYQPKWVALAVAAVLIQWLALAAFACWRRLRSGERADGPAAPWVVRPTLVLAVLLGVGFWLRFQGIEGEPRQWDEVENYTATRAFLERGFPSLEVHKDLPRLLIHTSELQFVPMALAALVTDDDRYVVRLPMVCFGTLTIGLIYLVGRRLFNRPVGLVAALLYTFSPVCIGMSSFGRYFSQVQFLALLSVYLLWRAVRGAGPVQNRTILWAAVSFIAMFLSWEGAALLAPGLMLAVLLQRRGRLNTVLGNPAVWNGIVLTALAVVVQYSHAQLVKTQFLWYGTSLSDLNLRPMWRYPGPEPWYYVLQSSWTQDALLPMLGLIGAGLLALRHPFRRPVRFLLVTNVVTSLIMALTLPGLAWRYIHHLIPLTILLASVSLVALARSLVSAAGRSGWARAVVALTALGAVVVASGMTVELAEMRGLRVEGYGTTVFKFPNFEGPARYLSDRLEEEDVVLATDPFHINHLVQIDGHPGWRTDYWLATTLRFPGTIDDRRSVPLDRRDGTTMLASVENLENLCARHNRVWVIVQPERHEVLSDRDVSVFLRQHFDVVYEDWEALVLFRGDRHRPAFLRTQDERRLNDAQANYLPP